MDINDQNIGADLTFLDYLTVFSVVLQTHQYVSMMRQVSNNEILHDIEEEQERVLKVLLKNQEKILENQQKILSLLEK